MSEELKPCPFCGKDADYQEDEDFISCLGTEGGCGFYYNVEGELDEAVKTWNRREPYATLVEELAFYRELNIRRDGITAIGGGTADKLHDLYTELTDGRLHIKQITETVEGLDGENIREREAHALTIQRLGEANQQLNKAREEIDTLVLKSHERRNICGQYLYLRDENDKVIYHGSSEQLEQKIKALDTANKEIERLKNERDSSDSG